MRRPRLRSPSALCSRRRRWLSLTLCLLVVGSILELGPGLTPAEAQLTLPLENRTDLDYGIQVTRPSGPLAPVRALPGVPTFVDATGDAAPDLLVTVLGLPAVNTVIGGLNDLVAPNRPPGQAGILPLLPDGPALLSGLLAIPGLLPLPPALPTAGTHAAEIAIARLAAAPLPVRVELVFVINGQEIRVGYDGRRSTAPAGFNATARIQSDNRRVGVATGLFDAGADLGIVASLRPLPGTAGPSFNADLRFAPVPRTAGFLFTQAADGAVAVETAIDRPARLAIEELRFTEPPPPGRLGEGTTAVRGMVDQLPTTLALAIRSDEGRPTIHYEASAGIGRVELNLTKQEAGGFGRVAVGLGLTDVTATTIDFLVGADQSLAVCTGGSSFKPCVRVTPGGIGRADFSVAMNRDPHLTIVPPARDFVSAVIGSAAAGTAGQVAIVGHLEGVKTFTLTTRDPITASLNHRPGSLGLGITLQGRLRLTSAIHDVPATASFSVATSPLDVVYLAGAPITSIGATLEALPGTPALFESVRRARIDVRGLPENLRIRKPAAPPGTTRDTRLVFSARSPVGSIEVGLTDFGDAQRLPDGVDGVRFETRSPASPLQRFSFFGRATRLRTLDFTTRSTCPSPYVVPPAPPDDAVIADICQDVVQAQIDTDDRRPARVELLFPATKAFAPPDAEDRVLAEIAQLPTTARFDLFITQDPYSPNRRASLNGRGGPPFLGPQTPFVGAAEIRMNWTADAEVRGGLGLTLDLLGGIRTSDDGRGGNVGATGTPLRVTPLPATLTFCKSQDIRCLPRSEFDQYAIPDNTDPDMTRAITPAMNVDARDTAGNPAPMVVHGVVCPTGKTTQPAAGPVRRLPGCSGTVLQFHNLELSRLKQYSPGGHLIVDTDLLAMNGFFRFVDGIADARLTAVNVRTQNRMIRTRLFFPGFGTGQAVCWRGTSLWVAFLDVTSRFCTETAN
jgi:hypothetical protein